MTDKDALAQRLLDRLAGIGFADRYFGYYETCRGRTPAPPTTPEIFADVLAATGLEFRFNTREKFYRHRAEFSTPDVSGIGLNVAFPASTVELILVVETVQGTLGGPFPLLATRIRRQQVPDFTFSPRAPKLPFSDAAELRDAVSFGATLFREAEETLRLL